jgi:hypothetical protein
MRGSGSSAPDTTAPAVSSTTPTTAASPVPVPAAVPAAAPAASAAVNEAPKAPSTPKAPALPTEAQFQLTATPAGATAVFDNDPSTECTVPCSLNLSKGRHTFLLKAPGYREAQRIFEVPRDPGLIVNLEKMAGSLNLITMPAGLAVSIDGKEEAKKTPATFSLPPGEHKIVIAKGAEKQEFTVDIHDGATLSRSVDWSQ